MRKLLAAAMAALLSVTLFITMAEAEYSEEITTNFATHFDFGTVAEGQSVRHTYYIHNPTEKPITLEDIDSSCSCISIMFYDREIPPGENGKLSVRMRTDGYGGQDLQRFIKVKTTDPSRKKINLTLAGRVEKVYRMDPKVVKLNGKPGDEMEAVISIIPEKNHEFNILDIRADKGRFITYSLKEKNISGSKGYEVKIIGSKKDAGFFFDKLFLKTDDSAVPEITIGVFGKVKEG